MCTLLKEKKRKTRCDSDWIILTARYISTTECVLHTVEPRFNEVAGDRPDLFNGGFVILKTSI